jgi:hypothetical protein
MAITRPDIYEHNNPLNAIVDSNFVRGGIRSAVSGLNELYQIGSGTNDRVDQLKQHSTRVYVSGENQFYILKDISNRTNASGWEAENNIIIQDVVYTTGNQTVSGQKWFTYDDPTITQYSYNSKYANLAIAEGYGPGVVTFKPVIDYRTFTYGQPSYYYSGINYATGSVQIYFDTGDSRWKYYNGGLAPAFFIAKSPIVTPGGFEAKIPLKGWTDNSDQIVDIKFYPQIQHAESHASGERDALDPSSIGAVAVTGNQSITGIKTFTSELVGSKNFIFQMPLQALGDNPAYGLKLVGGNFTGVQYFGESVFISGGGGNSIGGSITLQAGRGAVLSGEVAGWGDLFRFNGVAIINDKGEVIAPSVVRTTSNQTISGVKTFTSRPTVNGTGVVLSGEVALLPTTIVYTTGNQTISGVKTFATGIIAPNLVYNTGSQYISGTKLFVGAVGIGASSDPTNNKLYFYDTGTAAYNTIQSFSPDIGITYFEFSDQTPSNTVVIDVVNKIISGNSNSSMNFTARPFVNGTGVLLSGEATSGPGSLTNVVYTTGNQTISGNKIFAENLTISGTGFFQNINLSNLSELNISGARINISGSSGVYINTDLQVTRSGTFSSGVNLQNSQIINAVPQLINVNSNFNITGTYNTRLILANSSTSITGTIVSGNATGFNVSINQIGTGQVTITGSGLGIIINSYGNQYKTAGQYAAISLMHTGNNGYLMYGNTAL